MEIKKLNTLRALAALIVLFAHFSNGSGWLGGVLGGRAGQYGVMLFFLLSGFLMGYLYIGKPFTNEDVKRYALARVGRMVPLYLLVVLSSFLLYQFGLQGLYEIKDVPVLLSHLLFIDGESVLWTIGPEIQFYSLFIGLWALAAWRPGYIYVLIAAVLIFLFFANFPRWYGSVYGVPYNFFYIVRCIPYFLIGMLLGWNYTKIVIPDYLKNNIFIGVLLLVPLLYPEFSPVTTDAKMKMWLSYEVLFVMSAIFFGIVFLVPDNNVLLANRIGDFLGKISYSLYLLHMPIMVYINTFPIAIELKLVLFLSLSILVAYLSYNFLEKSAGRYVRMLRVKSDTGRFF